MGSLFSLQRASLTLLSSLSSVKLDDLYLNIY
jgi:hypothetical protein